MSRSRSTRGSISIPATYVLDENLDKVRAEETKNKEARDKEGFDPGAVIPGVQAQWIQPLVFRANQGDCVKIKLSNKLEEGGGPVSLHIHGSSMVVSASTTSSVPRVRVVRRSTR